MTAAALQGKEIHDGKKRDFWAEHWFNHGQTRARRADGKLLEAQYLRHGAAVRQTLSTMLDQLTPQVSRHGGFGGDHRFRVP